MNALDGIMLVDKPSGVTSFEVVNHIRRNLVQSFPELERKGRRTPGRPKPPRFKCGHAGTLDPLATGLLIVLIGKGSRLAPFLLGLDKTYAATVRFGSGTDTLDREGEVVVTKPVPSTPEVVAECLDGFRGDILQVPPVYSALKRDGQALYKLARSGQDVPEPEARNVTIHRLVMTDSRWGGSSDHPVHEVGLEVACSSGTYIRSLARDLAQAAGSEGYLQCLRRLTIGPFVVTDGLADVMDQKGEGLVESLLPLSLALPHVPGVTLNEDEVVAVRQGQQPHDNWLDDLGEEPPVAGKAGRLFKMLDSGGKLVAVGRLDPGTGSPRIAAVIGTENSSNSLR